MSSLFFLFFFFFHLHIFASHPHPHSDHHPYAWVPCSTLYVLSHNAGHACDTPPMWAGKSSSSLTNADILFSWMCALSMNCSYELQVYDYASMVVTRKFKWTFIASMIVAMNLIWMHVPLWSRLRGSDWYEFLLWLNPWAWNICVPSLMVVMNLKWICVL
jgi:hypothetical protein